MLAAVLLGDRRGAVGAPQASADPQDLVPDCSGDQTPDEQQLPVPRPIRAIMDSAPGANPDLPLGLNPGNQPAV